MTTKASKIINHDIERIKRLVGTPYRMFFKDGTYCGCFFPVYKLYPRLPRFQLPTKDPADSWNFGIKKISEYAFRISKSELKCGDIVATKFNNELHVAVYIGKSNIIHVFRNHNVKISRLNLFNKDLTGFYRVKNMEFQEK